MTVLVVVVPVVVTAQATAFMVVGAVLPPSLMPTASLDLLMAAPTLKAEPLRGCRTTAVKVTSLPPSFPPFPPLPPSLLELLLPPPPQAARAAKIIAISKY